MAAVKAGAWNGERQHNVPLVDCPNDLNVNGFSSVSSKKSLLTKSFSLKKTGKQKKSLIKDQQENSYEGSAYNFSSSKFPAQMSLQMQQKHGEECIPVFSDHTSRIISSIPLTRSLFMDAYSKGKWNLSSVPCPPCFEGTHLLKAPESYNEASRIKAVDLYMNVEQWKDSGIFSDIIHKSIKKFQCSGASISLVDEKHQIVKYQHSLGFKEWPRKLSIDAHAILSTGFFIILDASKEWRLENNPLVRGVPNIKFYLGIPLVAPSGAVIGIFAIFDVFPRQDFEERYVAVLQRTATEIMEILNTPVRKELQSEIKNEPLVRRLGRATSQGFSINSNLVFEKDGSGTPYSQNVNFRLSKHDLDEETKESDKLWKALASIGNSKLAAAFLSKLISDRYGFNFVYIMEIRVSEPYQIASELFPAENKVDAETYRFVGDLRRTGDETIRTRVLGSYGMPTENLKFDPSVHFKSFVSEFGIFYKSHENGIRFKSGICLPFFRYNPKLVRRKPYFANSRFRSHKSIDLYLRSGGFLIAAFNEKERNFFENNINGVFDDVSVLRKIYMSN